MARPAFPKFGLHSSRSFCSLARSLRSRRVVLRRGWAGERAAGPFSGARRADAGILGNMSRRRNDASGQKGPRNVCELWKRWSRTVLFIVFMLTVAGVAAQTEGEDVERLLEETLDRPEGKAPERYRSPKDAWDEGAWDQALQGFLDMEVVKPESSALQMNIGAAHYRLGDFDAATLSFAAAAANGDEGAKAGAYYNLGNVAFRQGQLEEAIAHFQRSLELDPDDEDAKFNLEFVRDEIRRRHEEASKREQEQQEQQQQDGSSEQEDSGESEGSQEQQEGGGGEGQDRDQDGLPDEVEEQGQNPTDPDDPDSDQDGLTDGEEDLNRNGAVDPGETDPNLADSDGDGRSDAEERMAEGAAAGAEEEVEGREMTPAEAERYLQALEEGRPQRQVPAGRRGRVEKDW